MTGTVRKPVYRSNLRLFFGAEYFTLKRHIAHLTEDVKYAGISDYDANHEVFTHATPLLRKLRDVDMYLQYNKIINLKLALKKINNVTLYPGETFSFWKLVGKPSRVRGYKKGMILQNGTFKAGTGGGLCQLSNLLYWSAVHTPLTITERHRHGYDVFPDCGRTQPFGSGATCAYNYIDLAIRNDTGAVFKFCGEVTDTELKGGWFSDNELPYTYECYEKKHVIQAEYWGGYTRHNLIYRKKIAAGGEIIGDEYVTENHAIMMYSPFLDYSR